MVNILFAFINLCILAVIIVHIFKKSILGMINLGMYEQKSYLENLEWQHRQFKDSEEKIDHSIEVQDKYIRDLKQRIILWQQVIQKEQEKIKQDQVEQNDKIAQKRIQQADCYIKQQVERLSVPILKNKLELDLKKYFEDKEHGLAYVRRISENLNKL